MVSFSNAIGRAPNWALAYFHRGECLHELKEYHAAVADFTQVIGRRPNLAAAYSNRGLAYAALDLDEPATVDFIRAKRLRFGKS